MQTEGHRYLWNSIRFRENNANNETAENEELVKTIFFDRFTSPEAVFLVVLETSWERARYDV